VAGHKQITVEKNARDSNDFAYFKKSTGYGKVKMKYEEFLNLMNDESREFNYYFAEQSIPEPLRQDIFLH
jgi:hypothetical protein